MRCRGRLRLQQFLHGDRNQDVGRSLDQHEEVLRQLALGEQREVSGQPRLVRAQGDGAELTATARVGVVGQEQEGVCIERRDVEMSGNVEAGEAGAAPDEEREPDYRFTLANERTFLAWLRTALALDAAGIAVVHLLPQLLVPGVRELAGVSLVLLGAVVAGGAYSRWRRYQQALREGRPLPPSRLPAVLVVVLTVVSVLAVALLVIESAVGG